MYSWLNLDSGWWQPTIDILMITINNGGGEWAIKRYQIRDIEPQGPPLSRRAVLGRKPEVREAQVRPKKKGKHSDEESVSCWRNCARFVSAGDGSA